MSIDNCTIYVFKAYYHKPCSRRKETDHSKVGLYCIKSFEVNFKCYSVSWIPNKNDI